MLTAFRDCAIIGLEGTAAQPNPGALNQHWTCW
jgi:hypothetical protein